MYSWTKLHLSWSQSIWEYIPANSKTTIILSAKLPKARQPPKEIPFAKCNDPKKALQRNSALYVWYMTSSQFDQDWKILKPHSVLSYRMKNYDRIYCRGWLTPITTERRSLTRWRRTTTNLGRSWEDLPVSGVHWVQGLLLFPAFFLDPCKLPFSRSDHNNFESSATRENDLRKNEVRIQMFA